MLQFYYLSVTLNILGGLALLTGSVGERLEALRRMLSTELAKIILGVASVIVGVVLFFVEAPGNTVPVAGDLLPALSGLAVGAGLLADIFVTRRAESAEAQKIQKAAGMYRVPLAVVGMAVGFLHFLFARFVIL